MNVCMYVYSYRVYYIFLIVKLIFIYFLHVLYVLKIKCIFWTRKSQPKRVERDFFLFIYSIYINIFDLVCYIFLRIKKKTNEHILFVITWYILCGKKNHVCYTFFNKLYKVLSYCSWCFREQFVTFFFNIWTYFFLIVIRVICIEN